MAFTYGFYNSLNGDRKYTAEQFGNLFEGIITDGVFDNYGEIFGVTPGTGEENLEVVVGTGRAWFDHTWNLNDSRMVLTLDPADVTMTRIDAVVLQVNAEERTRENTVLIVKGQNALTEPQKPTLYNEGKIHQHPLAYVTVKPMATSITLTDIENVVGTQKETKFVTGILQTVKIDVLFGQWQGQFNDWFDNIKQALTDNVVTNLQKQIDDLVEYTDAGTSAFESLGIDPDSGDLQQVFDALIGKISLMTKDMGEMTLTVTTQGGEPLEGLTVNGLLDLTTGGAVTTNAQGIAKGGVTSGTSRTLSINGWADLQDWSKSYEIVKGSTYSDTVKLSTVNFRQYTSSQSIKFTKNVTSIDVSVGGAGGGGGSGYKISGETSTAVVGYGGGSGSINTKTSIQITPGIAYSLTVGSGGAIGDRQYINTDSLNGKAGGSTSAFSLSASGGGGGSSKQFKSTTWKWDPQYENGSAGSSGPTGWYTGFSTTGSIGGGGGGGAIAVNTNNSGQTGNTTGGAGGSPNGGRGGNASSDYSSSTATNGVNGGLCGGGGGAALGAHRTSNPYFTHASGGTGGKGAVAIRIHLIHE